MHSSSLIIAGVLALVGFGLMSSKSNAAKYPGYCILALAGLMVAAGVTG